MDFYNNIKTEQFVKYFVDYLRSKMELTQYIAHDEFTEPMEAVDDHIILSQNNLNDFIMQSIKRSDLKGDEIESLYEKKREEIFPLLDQHIFKYIDEVKVNYIDLDEEGNPISPNS